MTPQEKLAAIGQTTEGLWTVDPTGDIGPWCVGTGESPVCDVDVDADYWKANARLIALAPALRRFAERVLARHVRNRGVSCKDCGWQWPCPTVQVAQEELGE